MATGLSWASGLRLYLALFMVGALGRIGWIVLPDHLQILSRDGVLYAFIFMLTMEFLADKIPVFDSLWDSLNTFIRIPAGTALAASAVADIGPEWAFIAALLVGTLSDGSHFTKAGNRALINLSPEPFSNWAASFGEDFMAAAGFWAAQFAPALFFVGLALFLLLSVWLLPKIWRGVRLVLKRTRDEQVQPVTER